ERTLSGRHTRSSDPSSELRLPRGRVSDAIMSCAWCQTPPAESSHFSRSLMLRGGCVRYGVLHMPSIEFHGYTEEQISNMLPGVRERLADLPFREKIVFSTSNAGSKVTAWGGSSEPFLRVLCRPAHAEEVRERLTEQWDVEIVPVEFFPRKRS